MWKQISTNSKNKILAVCELSDLLDAVLKGQFSQGPGALHGLAVVFGAPAGAVDVDVVRPDPQGLGLH